MRVAFGRKRLVAPCAFAVVLALAALAGSALADHIPAGEPQDSGLPPNDPNPPPSIFDSDDEGTTPQQGETLWAFDGTWDTTVSSTSREWMRCDDTGFNCVFLDGETGPTLTLTAAEVGRTIRVRVRGTSATGYNEVDSAPTAVVAGIAPTVDAPTFSGTAEEGQTLKQTSTDSASGTPPIAYSRQWLLCDSGASSCNPIDGATGTSYTLTQADVGSTIRLRLTATNDWGSDSANSAASAVVAGAPPGGGGAPPAGSRPSPVVEAPVPPANGQRPTILGLLRRGEFVEASRGSWTGTAPISFAYQWQRCATVEPTSCADIPGAIASFHRVVAADQGKRLRVVVGADNPAPGVAFASSLLTGVVPVERLSPFPRVAIGGRAFRNGVMISLFRVRGPRGVTVTVRCRGNGCPYRRAARRMRGRALRLPSLQRWLRPGVLIEIFVTKPGTIGKFTSFRIRRGKKPARRDACLVPGSMRPSRCG